MGGHQICTLCSDYAVHAEENEGSPIKRINMAGVNVTVVDAGEQRYFIDGLVTDNTLYGTAGNDKINGLTGRDLLGGGAENDILGGDGDGNDYISSSASALGGRQQIGPGDQCVNWDVPGGTAPILIATMWWVYPGADVTILSGIESTLTDAQSDVIDAGVGDDRVMASWGDDRIKGGDGRDQLEGLAGDDIVEGDGDDKLWGDTGMESDSPYFLALQYNGDDYLDGEAGNRPIRVCESQSQCRTRRYTVRLQPKAHLGVRMTNVAKARIQA